MHDPGIWNWAVVEKVVALFLLLLIGYGSKKVRILKSENADLLNKIVFEISLPAYIFVALYSYHQRIPTVLFQIPFIGGAVLLLCGLLAYGIGRALKLEKHILGALVLVSIFGNTSYLGFPVISAAYGEGKGLVAAIFYDQFLMRLPLCTVGIVVIGAISGQRVDRKYLFDMLKMPVLWIVPLALLVRPVPIPGVILTALTSLGSITVPLAMIAIGLSLSMSSMKGMTVPMVVAMLMKFAVVPALMFLALRLVGVTGVECKASVMESAMPTAITTGIIAARYGTSKRFVAGTIFILTFLSMLTIPISLYILGLF